MGNKKGAKAPFVFAEMLLNQPFRASAPATISKISLVMAA